MKTFRIIYYDDLQDENRWVEIEAKTEKEAVKRFRGRSIISIKEKEEKK
jgi:hypothetical protein